MDFKEWWNGAKWTVTEPDILRTVAKLAWDAGKQEGAKEARNLNTNGCGSESPDGEVCKYEARGHVYPHTWACQSWFIDARTGQAFWCHNKKGHKFTHHARPMIDFITKWLEESPV